jgi:hypothetical protein
MRDDLPAGTVTFPFTDIEGSIKLLWPDRYSAASRSCSAIASAWRSA